jgi:hypothetical protein
MKLPKWIAISFLIIPVLQSGCSSTPKPAPLGQPFEMLSTTNGYLVGYRSARYSWNIDSDFVSMNIGVHQSVTFFLNPTNDHVERILLELQSADGKEGYYILDANGDGIPDSKTIKGSSAKQIFYHGKFLPLVSVGDKSGVMEDGKFKAMTFVNDHWEEK